MSDLFFNDNVKIGLAQSLADIDSYKLGTTDKAVPTLICDIANGGKLYSANDNKVLPLDGVYVHEYDAAVDDTAIGTATLRGAEIPGGVTVVGQFIKVETAVTGATTVGIGTADGTGSTETADIYAQAAVGSAYTTGTKATIPQLDDQTSYINITEGFKPTATIVGGAVTAGKFRVYTKVIVD